MSEQPIVTVRGDAVLEVEPEIARLSVTIAARDSDRAKALRLLNERARGIDDIVRNFGEAIDKVETAAVHVSPQLKNRKPQEKISGYVATVHHTLTVVDFSRLGELIAVIADQDLIEVAGPWWALRPDSATHRRARVEATHDAIRRARDYAEAVGSDLVGLLELADVGLISEMSRPAAPPAAPLAMSAAMGPMRSRAAAPEEFTFEITPVKQVVRASVEARFTMAPPDLAQTFTRSE
jgi:uncharacterized protein